MLSPAFCWTGQKYLSYCCQAFLSCHSSPSDRNETFSHRIILWCWHIHRKPLLGIKELIRDPGGNILSGDRPCVFIAPLISVGPSSLDSGGALCPPQSTLITWNLFAPPGTARCWHVCIVIGSSSPPVAGVSVFSQSHPASAADIISLMIPPHTWINYTAFKHFLTMAKLGNFVWKSCNWN